MLAILTGLKTLQTFKMASKGGKLNVNKYFNNC